MTVVGKRCQCRRAVSGWPATAILSFLKQASISKILSEKMLAVIRLMVEEFGRPQENRLRG